MSADATGPTRDRPDEEPPDDSEPATPSAAPDYPGYDDAVEQVAGPETGETA